MYSKNRFTLLLLISSVTTWSFAALGDIAGDRKIVTSKAYVDTKQPKISATTNTYTYDETNRPTADGSVVTTTTTQGVVSERGIATAPVSDGNGGYSNGDWLPTVGAMMNAINTATNTLSWTATETTAVGNYSTAFDGTTGNWPAADADKLIDGTGLATALSNKQNKIIAGTAGNVVTYTGTAGTVGSATVSSAATYTNDTLQNGSDIANITAVETKQDLIDAGNVLLDNFDDNDVYLPGLVAYDSTTQTLKGNQIGILDWATLDTVGMALDDYNDRDDLVPTVAAVSQVLGTMWNSMPQQWQALLWSNTQSVAINAYNSTFGNGTNNWAGSSADLINGQFLAKSLALKQNKLPEQDDNLIPGQAGSVLAPTTAGNVAQVALWSADGGDSTAWNIDDYYTNSADRAVLRASIPTVGAVEVGLNEKQNTIPTNHITWYEGSDDPEDDDPYEYVPALVVTNAAGTALNGNTIGIVSYEQIPSSLSSYTGSSNDNFVPTLRVVAKGLSDLNTRLNWSALEWSNNINISIASYYTDTNSGHWPAAGQTKLINGEFIALALAKKQNKLTPLLTRTENGDAFWKPIGGETIELTPRPYNSYVYSRYITAGGAQPLTVKPGADNVILYVNGTKTIEEFEVSNFDYQVNSITRAHVRNALVSLELLKDVYSELNTKIAANSRPTGTAGTVATYNGVTNGVQQFTETAIYDTANAYNATNDANKLATAGFVETKQNKIAAGTAGNVVTYTGTAGSVGSATVSSAADYTGTTLNNGSDIANITAVETKQNKIAAGTAGQVVTYTGTAGSVGTATVSSAADYTGTTLNNGSDIANITAVETKQDKIVASDILLLEENGDDIRNDIYTPSIVTHDSNDETLVGTQFGILSNSVIDDAGIGWEPPYLYDFSDRDDLVPTVAAITPELDQLWDGIDNVYNAKQDILTKQLYTTISKPTTNLTPVGGETIDIRGDNTNSSVGRRYITGGGSQALTTKSGADTVLSYVNGTKSLSDFQTSNFGASGKLSTDLTKNNAYILGALVSLGLLRDTYVELDSKISDAVSAIDFDTAETAAANAYSTTFSDSGTNTWPESDKDKLVDGTALANALSLKQNKVTTGLVEFYDGGNDPSAAVNVPALVATDSTGSTINGNTIGIVGGNYVLNTPYNNDIDSNMFQYVTRAQYDNFVPTLKTLALTYSNLLNNISNIQTYPWTALEWSNSIESAITKYYADNSHWPSDYATKLINGEFMAKALQLKQKKLLPALTATSGNALFYKPQGGETIEVKVATYNDYTYPRYITAGGATPLTVKEGADNVILYVNGTKTLDEFEVSNFNYIVNGDSKRFIKGALVSLELLKDVYSELNTKIAANSRPTGTAGTVATYNGVTNGVQQFTETAIYDTANAYNATNDANKLATAGFVETKQNKIGATSDGTNNTPNYVYDSSTNPNAAGSVVTTTTTAGTVGQRGIATAPVSDGNGGYSNGDWLPTVDAMMNAISSATPTISGTQNTIANYGANGALGSGIATYDGSGTYAPATDAGKIATAAAVETKQAKIPTTSDGSNSTPNYVYNATTNPTAAGSVVTTSGTAGTVGQRGIATAPTYDNSDNLTNGDWLPTMGAVVNAVNSHTPSGTANTIANYGANGALGNGIATYDASSTYTAGTDAGKIATAAAVETKQNKIAAGTSGNVVTYTGTAGSVGSATVSSAATYNNGTLQNGTDIANITAVETKQDKLSGTSGNLVTYGASTGQTGSMAIATTITNNANTVPTTQAVHNAINNETINRFLDYDEAGGTIDDYAVKIPKQLTHTGETYLETGDQVFWLPELIRGGDNVAFNLMGEYSHGKLVPTMDELAHALDGVLQTHETTSEWQRAASYYNSLNPKGLFELKNMIRNNDSNAVTFNSSGYLQTFAPSLEALMNESYELHRIIITKQDEISATSNGTNNTPNYVYNASTNPTADGSVVTTGATAGTVGQRGIAKAPTRDNNGDLTNENWIPTMGAVESMVSATDVSSNAINGIPLSTGGYFYGTSDTAADATTKVVSASDIPSTVNTDPPTGLMIIVKPDHTSTAEASSLQLNSFNAKSMRRNGAALTDSTAGYVWNEDYPTVWVYDGTYWQYAGGYDLNTTYTTMTITAGRAGTATTARSISAQNLKAIIHGTKLTDAATSAITFTPTNAAIDASTDTIMSALGKLQGQINNKQNQIAAGTAGQVVTYTGTAGSVGSATVSSAATYSSDTLTNGSDIANITAVESKVSKTQSTGYQVLTTGTNGTVTADYISVPVTTSGTGRPTSTNAPTGTAAIWIE